MLLLGITTLFTGRAHAQFSAPIHDVDNGARQPVHFSALVTFADGAAEAEVANTFTVPAGKRLVIETITGEIFVPIGQQVRVKLVTIAAGNNSPNHSLLFNSNVTFGQQDIYITTLPVRFYADGATQPFLEVQRNSSTGSSGTGEITFSGYLVKLP